MIRTFAAIGRQMGEDGTLIAMPDGRRQSLEEEADTLQAAPDYWSDAKKQKRVAEIMTQVHGTKAVGPGGG